MAGAIAGLVAVALLIGWMAWGFGLNVYEVDVPITDDPSDCPGATRFAVIGDFGDAGQPEADVAALVDGWDVDFVVTTGDNNYPHGEAGTIDENVGRYYHEYIHPYRGRFGRGGAENRFWPSLGNHDWDPGTIKPYLYYFTLPGNERYYDLERGPVHLFVLDSDPHEPDGRLPDSIQADWLEEHMTASAAPWRLVILHHPPYASSRYRGKDQEMRWPFAEWGASAVISGHDHLYERLSEEGLPYLVNGLGGRSSGFDPIHRFIRPIPGSLVRYNQDYGAMLVTADEGCINFSFINRRDELVDSLTLTK